MENLETIPQIALNLNLLLNDELKRMEARAGGEPRKDPKYLILAQVVERLNNGEEFNEIWKTLSHPERHALITRLENIAYFLETEGDRNHNTGPLRNFIDQLAQELYGNLKTPQYIRQKAILEQKLQELTKQE